MEKLKQLNNFTKITLLTGIILLSYGILSRIIPIYFFWESQSIGVGLLFLAVIGVLFNQIEKRKAQQKKSLGQKIGIGFFSFMLLIQLILIIVIPTTDAYQVAKEFAKTQEDLKTELGEIKGFGLLPSGGVALTKDVNGEKGNATITLLLKGDKAYKSVTFFVFKDYGKDWEVYGME